MKSGWRLLALGVLSVGVLIPDVAGAQEFICTFCRDCTNPAYARTSQSDTTEIEVKLPFEIDCDFPYSCEDLPECEPSEQEEQAELIAFIEESNVAGLRMFAARIGSWLEMVPERNLLLYESPCRKEVVGVYQLSKELFAEIE